MPGEQQAEEEEEEEMQEEMVLLVKGEEEEGEEKYEVVKLKIPVDNKEVCVPPRSHPHPRTCARFNVPQREIKNPAPAFSWTSDLETQNWPILVLTAPHALVDRRLANCESQMPCWVLLEAPC